MIEILGAIGLLFAATFVVLVVMGTAVGLFLGLCGWLDERF